MSGPKAATGNQAAPLFTFQRRGAWPAGFPEEFKAAYRAGWREARDGVAWREFSTDYRAQARYEFGRQACIEGPQHKTAALAVTRSRSVQKLVQMMGETTP